MSDLLGSILSSMDKPPSLLNEKQKVAMKKQKEMMETQKLKEKEKMNIFREKIEKRIGSFIKDSSLQKYKFEPMDKVPRSVVHDAVDVAGLTAFSFGEEEVNRYVMIFKKEFAPCDDELAAYRRGEEWNPEKHKALMKQLELEKSLEEQEELKRKLENRVPNSDYKDKYEKWIGKESAKDAAKITTPNKQFGNVPSENKRDQRSIEQTLADIRAKKKQKIFNVNCDEAKGESSSS
ncbi:Sperm-associated antigen 7 [Nymphon striatum]|nr:Sperm-associated antigen 7 [Nymphon striatum]